MRYRMEQTRSVPDKEDPRDTKIRELQAALKVARGDIANQTQTISKSGIDSAKAVEQIKVLTDKLEGYEQRAASAIEGMEQETIEKNQLREELAVAKVDIDTLNSRLQELELEQSVSDSGAMLDASQMTSDEKDESDGLGRTSLIQTLDAEAQRWKRHCQVLGDELKTQREKMQQAVNIPAPVAPVHVSSDQLSEIRGIGVVLERKLNQLGIRRFEELADISPEEMKQASVLIPDLKARLRRYEWVDQARSLHSQKYG